MRRVILHNHLFKNAGTSVDLILQRNFPGRWRSREFSMTGAGNTAEVSAWIAAHPEAVAFSSHTLMGPLPVLPGVALLPIALLRDPIERIASAYRFEAEQMADTLGAHLAKQHGFSGYVHARLSRRGDRQCRNFHTHRLSSLVPGPPEQEFARACAALRQIAQTGILGLVSEFDAAMDRLAVRLAPEFDTFAVHRVTANASSSPSARSMSEEMRGILRRANAQDLALIAEAQRLIDQLATGSRASQEVGTA